MEINAIAEAIEMSAQYGIFAGLFIGLLIYVIKNNDKRESSLQLLVTTLNDEILKTAKHNNEKITGVTEDIDVLDTKIQHMSEKVDSINIKVEAIDKSIEILHYKLPNL